MTQRPAHDPAAPVLRVVRGHPSDAELAALVVALAVATAPAGDPAPPPRSPWGDPRHALRRPLAPGPGAWRASALPH